MQICHKEITVVYFHPLFASHPFILLPSLHGSIQWRIQDFNKGGGGHKTRHQRRESRKSQTGGGGRSDTFLCSEKKKYVSKGGAIVQNNFKGGGGHGPGCAPPPPLNPPLAPSIHVPIIMMITVLKIECHFMALIFTNWGGGVKMWVGEVHCIIENYCYVKVWGNFSKHFDQNILLDNKFRYPFVWLCANRFFTHFTKVARVHSCIKLFQCT